MFLILSIEVGCLLAGWGVLGRLPSSKRAATWGAWCSPDFFVFLSSRLQKMLGVCVCVGGGGGLRFSYWLGKPVTEFGCHFLPCNVCGQNSLSGSLRRSCRNSRFCFGQGGRGVPCQRASFVSGPGSLCFLVMRGVQKQRVTEHCSCVLAGWAAGP